jgi:hypothetical protein
MHLQGSYILKLVELLTNKQRGALLFIQQKHVTSSRISAELFSVPTLQTYYRCTENAVSDRETLILLNELKLKITKRKVSPLLSILLTKSG